MIKQMINIGCEELLKRGDKTEIITNFVRKILTSDQEYQDFQGIYFRFYENWEFEFKFKQDNDILLEEEV